VPSVASINPPDPRPAPAPDRRDAGGDSFSALLDATGKQPDDPSASALSGDVPPRQPAQDTRPADPAGNGAAQPDDSGKAAAPGDQAGVVVAKRDEAAGDKKGSGKGSKQSPDGDAAKAAAIAVATPDPTQPNPQAAIPVVAISIAADAPKAGDGDTVGDGTKAAAEVATTGAAPMPAVSAGAGKPKSPSAAPTGGVAPAVDETAGKGADDKPGEIPANPGDAPAAPAATSAPAVPAAPTAPAVDGSKGAATTPAEKPAFEAAKLAAVQPDWTSDPRTKAIDFNAQPDSKAPVQQQQVAERVDVNFKKAANLPAPTPSPAESIGPADVKPPVPPQQLAGTADVKPARATDTPGPALTPAADEHDLAIPAQSDALTATPPSQPAMLPEPLRALTASLSTGSASALAPSASASAPGVPLIPGTIAVAIAARAHEGARQFDIRLDPPELGRIDVRLDVDKSGEVSTRLTVDRPETLQLLQSDARGLERALQSAGLKTDDGSLQFSLRQQSPDGSAGQQAQGGADPRSATIYVDEDESVTPGIEQYQRAASLRGGVDIRV